MTEKAKMVEKSAVVPVQKKERRFKLRFSRKNLCIPYGLFLALFVILPLLVVVYYAFTDNTGAISFSNFTDFFTNTTKISTLLVSVLVSFIVTAICLLIAYPVAYILSKMKGRIAFILLLLFIMPMWINFVLRAMAMKELLSLVGIPLGSTASIIGLVYDYLPFMILPLYSTLIKMDRSLEEAAADLGAGKIRTFREVTLPLSIPGIISGAMMVFLPVMSCYVITDAFSGASGFTVLGKLIAWCFLGENGTMTDQHGGAMISLIMLVILFVTMLATGGFKSENSVRGTNL